MNAIKGKKGFIKGAAPWSKGLKMPYEITDQNRQNKSLINKGKTIFNNGKRNIFLMFGEDIPDGFVRGMLITDEDRSRRSERMRKINQERWNSEVQNVNNRDSITE